MTCWTKNICDQTLYAVEGIAKLPKIHRVLFLDQPESGAGQLAVAIGRKNHSSIAEFASATPGRADLLSAELREFLDSRGLPDEDLETEQLESMEHDIANYNLIVCLNGRYSDYISKIPFHSSALNWEVNGLAIPRDRTAQYRSLRARIDALMRLVDGESVDTA
jgi:hypothetical protein